jgi:creatinine amidohydrolase/Fe(II)-dependent formamide hydrolase-like protein
MRVPGAVHRLLGPLDEGGGRGDPTRATAEKDKALFEVAVSGLIRLLD